MLIITVEQKIDENENHVKHVGVIFLMVLVCWQNGTADAASMSADDIYAAGLCYGLELAAGESYNGVGGSY